MALSEKTKPFYAPGGGFSNYYSDDPEDWGIPFADVKSANLFYTTRAKARAGGGGRLGSGFGSESPSQVSARNIAEQSHTQKLINSQGVPPSGFGSGGSFALDRTGGSGGGGYATGLIPPRRRGGGAGGGELEIPVYDQERVEALAQRVAAPGIRKLRDEVQQAQGGVYDNPNVKAMTLRQALQGYGSGLESVMGGAFTTGAGLYGKEYDPKVAEATTNYRGNLERELQSERLATQERISQANIAAGKENSYQNAWNEWRNVWN